MKDMFVFFFAVLFIKTGVCQQSKTYLDLSRDYGSVKEWAVIHQGAGKIGTAFTIEKKADVDLILYPEPSDWKEAILVLTGTYTSANDSIAGEAYDDRCDQVGNTEDPYFKPNAWLSYDPYGTYHSISLEDKNPKCRSVGVYRVIKDNIVLHNIIDARTKKEFAWRFLVKKEWKVSYDDGSSANGYDWMIIDFDIQTTLENAVTMISRLARRNLDTGYTGNYSSVIDACLLDVGAFRPIIFAGKEIHGKFPQDQSNVIMVK